jgi:photosystem II stability/assembly factor-like uncharacterized protein
MGPLPSLVVLLGWFAQEDSSATRPVWERIASPVTEDLRALWFANTRLGWVLGEGGTVLRTADGGASWKVQRQGGKAFRHRPFEHLWFKDERRGWIAQCSCECDLAGVWPVQFLQTADGGETWTEVKDPTPQDRGRLIEPFSFETSTRDRWARSHQGSVYFSPPDHQDGRIPNLLPSLAGFGKMFEARYLDVSFATRDSGTLVGAGPTGALVLRTDDGGRSWVRQSVTGVAGTSVRRVWMSDPSEVRLVADGSPSVWATRDGGKTWKIEWPGKSGEQVSELAFPGRGFGLAVGKEGLLLRYSAR